jgi:DNA-binding NarL/FixJ family response regulator
MTNKPISVVIVDDQPLMRTALRLTLAVEDDLRVVAELDGSTQALKVSYSLSPDMILLSVGNPGQNDLEAISTLRKQLPTTAIMALVTGELRGQEQEALAHGAHSVLTKSVSRTELLGALYKLQRTI